MKIIDVRKWDDDVRDTLSDAAVSGGAILQVGDNLEVVVIDIRLWKSLEQRLPSFSEIIHDIRTLNLKK